MTGFEKRPILLIDADAGTVKLISRREMTDRVNKARDAGDSIAVMMDLVQAAKNFGQLVGKEDRSFEIHEIQEITFLPKATVENWLARGLFAPSVRAGEGGGRGRCRLFSWGDAFTAGVLAALRRQGVSLSMLSKVSRLLASTIADAKHNERSNVSC